MNPEERTTPLNPSCDTLRPLLSAWVDGEVTTTEKATLEAHLTLCEDCASHLAFLRLLSNSLPAPALAPLPRGLAERIAAGTYARPSVWDRLAVALRPAPVRLALGGALATATVLGVLLPRLPAPRQTATAVSAPTLPERAVAPDQAPVQPETTPAPTPAPRSQSKGNTSVVVARREPTKSLPPAPLLPAPRLATPQEQHQEKVIVIPAATPAPSASGLIERESPKGASLVATSSGSGTLPTASDLEPAPALVRTTAFGGRPHTAISAGLVEQGGADEEGTIKVTLSVTAKQMKEAVGKIGSLSVNAGEPFTTSNRLTIADAPATLR